MWPFSDGLNRVAFDGSCNFSRTALIENIESITAFCDWDGQGDVFKINDIQEEFNRTFTGYNDTVTYLSCDKVKTAITTTFAEKDIKELVEDENVLISKSLEKELPSSISKYLTKAKVRVLDMIDKMAPSSHLLRILMSLNSHFLSQESIKNRLLIIGRTISSKACLLWLQVQVKH